jgi:multiple sugar transport system substrate-binding protein
MSAFKWADSVSRRDFMKRMAGVAGILALPEIMTACNGDESAERSGGPGSVRFASTWTGDTKALRAIVDEFTAETGINVEVNEVDGPTFSDQINSYLQGTPDDAFTWFGGYRMRFYAAQGLLYDISDVWAKIGSNFSDAFKAASTGDDGNQYLIPFYNYPWVVIYRRSFFDERGYVVPETLADFKALADDMTADGLVPLAFADQDGWPAMGWFDIINMRVNGYQFHIDLLAGNESWTDPRVAAVFDSWRDFLPYYGNIAGALGRTWQDGAKLLFNDKAGMLFFGTFAGTEASDPSVHDDLDFFPFPKLGTEFDDENAVDAPINGFLVGGNSPTLEDNLDAVKTFIEYLASGEAQTMFLAKNPNFVAAANDADTNQYVPFQKNMAEIIGESGAIAQFLDRDTDPAFATEMQSFLQSWLTDPDQDMDQYLGGIQDFWDSLAIS